MKRLFAWLCAASMLTPTVCCAAPSGPNSSVSHDEDPQADRAIAEGVSGTIKDEGGHAVEGAIVTPKSLDANAPPIPEIAIVSDKDGQYQWPLRPGRYEVTARASGYRDATQQVTVTARTVTTLDFALRRRE